MKINYTGDKKIIKRICEAINWMHDHWIAPTKTSDLINDGEDGVHAFISNVVNDLANYYLKTETYTKTEVDQLISAIQGMHIEVVQTLPTQDISTTTIYLVPKQTAGTQDVYDEYIYVNNAWEHIGSTEIDLSNYYTKTEIDTMFTSYVTSSALQTILADYVTTTAMNTALADKVDKIAGKGLSTEDYTTAEKTKLAGIETGAQVNTVTSVNGQTGVVVLDADDVGALPDDTPIPSVSANPASTTSTLTGIEINGVGYAVQGGGSGTVTSVNNVLPDANGNVTIAVGDDNVQSDWNQTDTNADDFIKNKPDIPSLSNTWRVRGGSGITASQESPYNLNTLVSAGTYYMNSNSQAEYVLNKPTTLIKRFTLIVQRIGDASDCIKQVFMSFDNKTYWRTTSDRGATWSAWGETAYISDILAPLVGTTSTITPTQVKTAIAAGTPISISHTDTTQGTIIFNDFVDYQAGGMVFGMAGGPANQQGTAYNMFTLIGIVSTDAWALTLNTLPDSSSLATVATSGSYSDLTNPPTNATASADGFMSSTDFKKINVQAIAANTDLNTITAYGWYSTNQGTTLVNAPTGMVQYAAILVYATGASTRRAQICIFGSSYNKVFMRLQTSATAWTAWRQIACIDDLPTKLSDLTDDVVSGNYVKTSNATSQTIAATSVNNPLGVKTGSGGTKAFISYLANNGTEWGRIGVNNNGVPIFSADGTTDSRIFANADGYTWQLAAGIPITATAEAHADLNTFTTFGTYYMSSNSANLVDNRPVTNSYRFTLIVQRIGNNSSCIRQIYMTYSNAVFYVRATSNGGSTWTDWTYLALGTHLDSYVKLSNAGTQSIVNSSSSSRVALTIQSAAANGTLLGFYNPSGTALGFFGVSSANKPIFRTGNTDYTIPIPDGNTSHYLRGDGSWVNGTADSTKLPLAGGQMTGVITFAQGSIVQQTANTMPFFLGIDAFASGGAMKWQTTAGVVNALNSGASGLVKKTTNIQSGTMTAAAGGNTVTFPTAFSGVPVVVIEPIVTGSRTILTTNVTKTNFSFNLSGSTCTAQWIAYYAG